MSIIGAPVVSLPHLSVSSMEYAKKHIERFDHGTLIKVEKHTQARGRHNRTWTLMEGQLLLTYVIKPDSGSLLHLFMAFACAVHKALQTATNCSIKWPNDIVYKKKKIAGMLFEPLWIGEKRAGIVFGLGANVNTSFPAQHPLRERATSLYEQTNTQHDLLKLEKILSQKLSHWYEQWQQKNYETIFSAWEKSLAYKGEEITIHSVTGEVIQGQFVSVQPNGNLVLMQKDTIERAFSFSQTLSLSVTG